MVTGTAGLKNLVYSMGIIAIAFSFAALFVLELVFIIPISFAFTYNGIVVATVNVPSACAISLTPNAIGFGVVAPSQSTAISTLATDTNGGNTNTIIFVGAGNWISTTNNLLQFGTAADEYTAWNPTSTATYSLGNVLQSTAQSTSINIAANSDNVIYFGVSIPPGQTANVYNQNIIIENSC